MSFWHHKKILVTGGSGFLGTYVVEKLVTKDPRDVFVPRSAEYDLRDVNHIRKVLADFQNHKHTRSRPTGWVLGAPQAYK